MRTISSEGLSLICLILLKSYTLEFDTGAECHLTDMREGAIDRCVSFCARAACVKLRWVVRWHCRQTFDVMTAVAAGRAKDMVSVLKAYVGGC